MKNKEVLEERERIKRIILRKSKELMFQRQKLSNHHSSYVIPLSKFNRLIKELIFLIDNPDYIKIKDRTSGANLCPLVRTLPSFA